MKVNDNGKLGAGGRDFDLSSPEVARRLLGPALVDRQLKFTTAGAVNAALSRCCGSTCNKNIQTSLYSNQI